MFINLNHRSFFFGKEDIIHIDGVLKHHFSPIQDEGERKGKSYIVFIKRKSKKK